MKATIFCWLLLLSIPGCLLLQPLDDAKPEGSAGGPNGGSAGSGNGSSGGPSKAGNGNAGHAGSPAGGAANGGGPSETDFSLFTGTWFVQAGSTIERSCSDGEDYSSEVDWTTDEFVEGGGGSSGDILLNPTTPCALAFDVDDRIAYAQSGQSCTLSDGDSLEQTLEFTSAAFAVDDDESTATASVEVDETISDASGTLYCTAYWTLYYQRGAN